MRALSYGAAAMIACCMVISCGGEDDDDPASVGRGTQACRDFQDATCDFGADRCHAIDRATCDAMLRGIECTSDERASECSNALNSASCNGGMPSCDLQALADRAPAIAKCETLIQALCDHNVMCGAAAADCTQVALTMGVDCSQALSIELRYEECIDTLATLPCGVQAPAVCERVVLVLPPTQ
jgi:hypothetical protein